jgi:hypothetical protein
MTLFFAAVSFTCISNIISFEFATPTLDTPLIRLQKSIGDYLRMYDVSAICSLSKSGLARLLFAFQILE